MPAEVGEGEGVGLLYVRVVIFWICVRSAGYDQYTRTLSMGGGLAPGVAGVAWPHWTSQTPCYHYILLLASLCLMQVRGLWPVRC